jgi:hypothetical protein
MKYNIRFNVLLAMVLGAAASRLLPHPPNFTPIGAMALFGGACFRSKWQAFLVPLAAMMLSDFALGLLHRDLSLTFHPLLPVVYGCFALAVCLGLMIRGRRTLANIAATTLASSVVFFLITNFAVWAMLDLYPKTWSGLVACYVAAIPFFQNSLGGDLFYSTILFGSLALLEANFPALREREFASAT